jgi:AraC-like DNA-binding protein
MTSGPDSVHGRRQYVFAPPALHPFVERIWSWQGGPDLALPTLLPGTGEDLLIHVGGPLRGGPPGAGAVAPQAHILSPRQGAIALSATGPVDFLAIRLRVGALRHFTDVPIADLNDRLAPVREALGPAGDAMAEAIASADGFGERARRAAAHLVGIVERRGASPDPADDALARLYYSAGRARVREVARALGASERQLHRVVERAVGLSPKRFQRLVRFHHVVRRLLLEGRRDYLDVALDHGFFDQAHVVHEFRAITGRTPLEILRPSAFASHFYNPPRSSRAAAPVGRCFGTPLGDAAWNEGVSVTVTFPGANAPIFSNGD